MTIQELKKELGIKDKDIAEFFSLTARGYYTSSAKSRYEKAFVAICDVCRERWQKENKKESEPLDQEPA